MLIIKSGDGANSARMCMQTKILRKYFKKNHIFTLYETRTYAMHGKIYRNLSRVFARTPVDCMYMF